MAELKPYQQKELMRQVLHKAILGPNYVKIALYGRPPEVGPLAEAQRRFQTFKWPPGLPSQSAVLWDCLAVRIKRVARGRKEVMAHFDRSGAGALRKNELQYPLYGINTHYEDPV